MCLRQVKPEACTEMHQVFICKQLHSCQSFLDHLRGEQSSHIFSIGGGMGHRKGPFQILLAVAWDYMAGWAPGRCPWALQQRHNLCVLPHLSYCTDSCCLCGVMLPLCGWRPFLLLVSAWDVVKLDCASSQHWEPVCWKTVENKGGCGPPISSPKIEVRGKKWLTPAFPGPRSRVLQQTPQRLPRWGGETPTNESTGAQCVCGCECACAANSAPPRLRSCSHGWVQRWLLCVRACVRLPAWEQMVQPLQPLLETDQPFSPSFCLCQCVCLFVWLPIGLFRVALFSTVTLSPN